MEWFNSDFAEGLKAVLLLSASLFIFMLGLAVIAIIVMYFMDRSQTHNTILRNYPVLGRMRYYFNYLGEFFRQYFFAGDREELPFNRAQRNWVYNAAKDADHTIAFGSTKDLRLPGAVIFLNCPWPTLEKDGVSAPALRIGPYCEKPFDAPSFFNTSAMSYGALSIPAVRALAKGAKKAGCWMNTGEGGISPYHLEGGCDLVAQIGTAKYGFRDHDGNFCDEKLQKAAAYPQVKMFEIKLSQGAKPGKGGMLPGIKVNKEVSEIRGIPMGKDSISPNRHLDIGSIDDLLDMIERIRRVTGKPVGMKFVMGAYSWLEDFFTAINERGIESAPDFITLDSGDGGTGAAPMPLMDDVGLVLDESLPILITLMKKHGVRDRIRLIASGKLINPTRVAWALAMGVDFCVSARGFLMSLGCIQSLQCNKNTCPTGITTTNPNLQRGLVPEEKFEKVASYHKNLIHEVGLIAHSCGVPEPRRLKPFHIRVVQKAGTSKPATEIYAEEKVRLIDSV